MANQPTRPGRPVRRRSTGPGGLRTLMMLPVLLLFVALQSACAMPWQDDRPVPASQDEMEETVLLDVDNRNFQDARIYLLWDGIPDRAGMVTGKTQETLRVESRPGELQIQVDFVAGGSRLSDPIQVWDGETVEVLIPAGNQPIMTWTS